MYAEYMVHVDKVVSYEIKEFVKNEVFRNSEYLFVRKVNGINIGYCSKCGNEYSMESVSHNERGVCPICGATLTVKLIRYGRKKCTNEACFYYFEKSIVDPKVIVCKGYYVCKSYEGDYKKPNEEYSLMAIYVFENKKSVMLTDNYYRCSWDVRSSVFDFNQGWLANKACHCSFESIEKAIKDTCFQYIPYKLFEGCCSMVKLFAEYSKHPWIEQLSKMGFEDLVKDKLEGRHMYNCFNYKGKDIYKILKLSRKDIKDIRDYTECITPEFISLYQLQSKDKSGLSPKEVDQVKLTYGFNYTRLKDVLKHTTMKKALKYMDKQYEKYKNDFSYKGDVLLNWSDYIEDCIKLDMDLKLKNILYPGNLNKAHQNTIKQIKIKGNKIYDEKIKKRVKKLNEYIFEYKGLLIRPALSSKELIEESKALSHCVASNYTDRYANGETNILLIRKVSDKDRPYFTLELKKNKIVQVRGKRNCNPNEETLKFIEAFKIEKLYKKKSKTRISIPA